MRSAHEGTLEYVSRDGHLGCVSRRGDMECLLYVIIEWLGGHLPWDTDTDDRLKPDVIQQMKIEAFHDVKGFLTHKAFKGQTYPQLAEDLMKMVKQMRFEEAPDYNLFRSLFRPYMPPRNNFDNVEMGQNNNKENILYDIAEEDEMRQRDEEEQIRMENIYSGNPLLREKYAGEGKGDMKIKKRWDDDVMFKNCSRAEPDNQDKTFINDSLRNEFHRKFMDKYVK